MRWFLIFCSVLLGMVGCGDQSNSGAVPPSDVQSQSPSSQASAGARTPNSLSASTFPFQIIDKFDVGNRVYVRALAMDHTRKHLWVGTSIGAIGVDVANDFQVSAKFTRDNGLANEYVFTLLADSQGDIWFGTNGGGASRYHQGKFQTYFPLHGLADYWVYSFAETAQDYWVGTWAGLSRIDKKTGKITNYVKELINEWVYGLAVDNQGRLWIGTEGGLNRYDGKDQWSVWTHQDGLGAANNAGLPISENTGLGTRHRHDLSVMSQGKPTYNPNYIFCVLVDKDDQVWAGTWGGGLAKYDGKKWHNYTNRDGLGGNIIYAIDQDPVGRIWVGTDGGVSVLDSGQWFTLNRQRGLPSNHVYAVASGEKDVWIGLQAVVIRLGTLEFKRRSR